MGIDGPHSYEESARKQVCVSLKCSLTAKQRQYMDIRRPLATVTGIIGLTEWLLVSQIFGVYV